jgi:response regulator RpfG family c-di-GMP phosphodiesterase
MMPAPEPRLASSERKAAANPNPLELVTGILPQNSLYTGNAAAAALAALQQSTTRYESVQGAKETSSERVRVLVAEADAACRENFTASLRRDGYEVVAVKTGAETLEALRRTEFDMALLDSELPDLRGLDLLRAALNLRPETPFALLAWRANVEMARAALTLGASDFVTRPFPIGDLPIIAERNLTRQALQRRKTERMNPLSLPPSQEGALDTLLTALNGRGTEPPGHSERVTAYTMEMIDRMRLSPSERYPIERGALLHDIGKIGIPDRILLKTGPLTPEEWVEVRKHPVIGHQMCAPVPLLRDAALLVRHHHEKWDGSGYPDGLAGANIPFSARIFALADALDAMTSERPYRKTISLPEARAEIERCVGSRFDPEIAAMFLSIPVSRLEQIRSLADR